MSEGFWPRAHRYFDNVSYVSWRLTKSTGKAAWIAGTTLLILAVPLVVEMDREQALAEIENNQLGALTGGPIQNK